MLASAGFLAAPVAPDSLTIQLVLRVLYIVAGKDADSVDNDWFLCACAILDHAGPLLTSFPVENRLIPQVRRYNNVMLYCYNVMCLLGQLLAAD
jgi:hypothetical protein